MPLNLIKLCVGVQSVDELRAWREAELGRGSRAICRTRQTPKRGAECAQGGSLYWVIRGAVLCRQAIVSVDTFGDGPASRCEITLGPDVILTEPQPRRAFQGWRYLTAADAPRDLIACNDGDLPVDLTLALREIGAW
jgi:hypothetical protein